MYYLNVHSVLIARYSIKVWSKVFVESSPGRWPVQPGKKKIARGTSTKTFVGTIKNGSDHGVIAE